MPKDQELTGRIIVIGTSHFLSARLIRSWREVMRGCASPFPSSRPSPRGEGEAFARHSTSRTRPDCNHDCRTILPLPRGEGRGEGKGDGQARRNRPPWRGSNITRRGSNLSSLASDAQFEIRLPLPKGEGRGEGKGNVQLHDITLNELRPLIKPSSNPPSSVPDFMIS